jgi:hypothetical protein
MEKISALLRILEGTAEFQPVVKNLYDYGLLFYNSSKRLVLPVSEQARLALHALYAQVAPRALPRLSEIETSSERGHQFERYVLASMLSDAPLHMLMPQANSPDVKKPIRMDAVVTYYHPETNTALLDKLESHPTMRAIWKSKDEQCIFDGVLMPPESDPSSPIVIFDPSLTSPYENDRVEKVNKLAGPFAAVLREKFPRRPVHVVAFWSEDLKSIKPRHSTIKKITSTDVFIADRELLRKKMPNINF